MNEQSILRLANEAAGPPKYVCFPSTDFSGRRVDRVASYVYLVPLIAVASL